MNFKEFLAKKNEHYAQIDKFRSWRIYEAYKELFGKIKIIHIIGTNGKGSTGRFLAQLLKGLEFSVGHYTSPHIFEFNERFWLNGAILSDNELEKAHENLASLMSEADLNSLSYFEYATFLAAFIFKDCDFIIFEAGLGGEYDATSVFEKALSIFTPISKDHTQILGENLLDIARTKLKVMSKNAVISSVQEKSVLKLAEKIALLKNSNLYKADEFIISQGKEFKNALESYIRKYNLPEFLQENLKTALCALNFLINSAKIQTNLASALNSLQALDLRGRCEKINENIIIDVGHNEEAARALARHFEGQKFTLIYNSFLDKNIFAILSILKPLIDKILIYDYFSQRQLATKKIKLIAKDLGIACKKFKDLRKDKNYLVFGSFVLVESFLREYFEEIQKDD
ncbi:Mur ligase family protein [Campylobacter troglodytis]|uniref:Mur ligase family protein n=1 Tax=Campylobacter troglodytis TaxID=654363 RepID=UPI0011574D1D|nr:Mur ligase family protein [Campylobacter troglodytis]TQR60816.1 bifunctional folylpolyglutamate synthase/dihydrofolate synthase [Campylobacter troglodytis]